MFLLGTSFGNLWRTVKLVAAIGLVTGIGIGVYAGSIGAQTPEHVVKVCRR